LTSYTDASKSKMVKKLNQTVSSVENPRINISDITKNILVNSNIMKMKPRELRDVIKCFIK